MDGTVEPEIQPIVEDITQNVVNSDENLIATTVSPEKHEENQQKNDAACRICHAGEEEGKLFHPCKCSGSVKVRNNIFFSKKTQV